MKSRWVHSLAAAVGLLTVAWPGHAITPEAEGPLGLVRVSGGSYRESRDLARSAEDILHRLENLAGRPLAAPSKPLVRIALPEKEWGMPSLNVTAAEAGLPWLIDVRGPFQESADDFTVHMARLALSIWTGSAGAAPRADWLAVGLAENLFPVRKARNREWVSGLAEEGRLPALDTIFTWIRMPAGPIMEKAVCGQATGWMLAAYGKQDVLGRILDRVKTDGRVPADWLMTFLSEASPENPEAAWRQSVSRRDIIAGGARPLTPNLFRQLRRALQTPASDLGLGRPPELPSLSPWQLLAVRRAPGAKKAAESRAAEVQKLAVGTPPEFQAAVLAYRAFFDRVGGRTPAFWLRRRLRQADRALRELEDLSDARTAWLDRVAGGDDGADSDGARFFTRSALERYVDEAETRSEDEAQKQAKE